MMHDPMNFLTSSTVITMGRSSENGERSETGYTHFRIDTVSTPEHITVA